MNNVGATSVKSKKLRIRLREGKQLAGTPDIDLDGTFFQHNGWRILSDKIVREYFEIVSIVLQGI